MDRQDFESKLLDMTKPEVSQLKHQAMLATAITRAKDRSVLSWWWLSVPLYILAALFMKTLFTAHTTLVSNMHDFISRDKYAAAIGFCLLPILFAGINAFSIRNIYLLSGSPAPLPFLRKVWYNALIILISIFILTIYAL